MMGQEYHYTIQNFSFETSLLTLSAMLKPASLKFYSLSTFYIPLLLFLYYFCTYFSLFQFSLLEGILFLPARLWLYVLLESFYAFVKFYVMRLVRNEEKMIE